MSANRRICYHCVHEPYLQRDISAHGTESVCSYCNRRANAYDLETLASRVDLAFEQHYQRTPPAPTDEERALIPESEWSRDGLPVVDAITRAAEIPARAAADVHRLLEARHLRHACLPRGGGDGVLLRSLLRGAQHRRTPLAKSGFSFEHTIKTQARFFGHHAKELLAAAFTDIDNVDEISVGGRRSLVIDIGPESRLKGIYRARVFQSEEALREACADPIACWALRLAISLPSVE